MRLKNAAFAPISRARLKLAVAASPGRLANQRQARRKSSAILDTRAMVDRSHWDQKHRDSEYLGEPSRFLESSLSHLPRGRALDVACGLGANALFLADAGFTVDGLDWSFDALRKLGAAARLRQLRVRTVACDVTRFPLPRALYDLVICFRFLERALWPDLVRALKPGGALVVETYTERHREKRPDFPRAYCLEEGELLRAFRSTLRPARYEELPGRPTASLLAFRGSRGDPPGAA